MNWAYMNSFMQYQFCNEISNHSRFYWFHSMILAKTAWMEEWFWKFSQYQSVILILKRNIWYIIFYFRILIIVIVTFCFCIFRCCRFHFNKFEIYFFNNGISFLLQIFYEDITIKSNMILQFQNQKYFNKRKLIKITYSIFFSVFCISI